MGTPATIATAEGPGWTGRACHGDGYPNALGLDLFKAYHDVFDGDIEAMVDKLIMKPTADWSMLAGTNMALAPAWYDEYIEDRTQRPPRNYQFRKGERPTPRVSTGNFVGQYVYFLEPDGLNVYVAYFDTGDAPAYAFFDWDTPIEDVTEELEELYQLIHHRR